MGKDCQMWVNSTPLEVEADGVKGNILYNRGIGFVSYESEHNASFAKEAMANQSMDMDEILNVR